MCFLRLVNFSLCNLDSYAQNNHRSSYFALDHSNERNHINTNYKTHNGTDTHRWSEFKTPIPLRNGSNQAPALVSAKSQAFDGTTILHRSYNKPQQTINPHYNRFGEPSELSNFKSVPDLYPIARTDPANTSYASNNRSLTNGYDHQLFATPRYANDTSVRSSTLSTPNTMSSSSVRPSRNRSIFLNCALNKKSTPPNTMGSKSNLTQYNVSKS